MDWRGVHAAARRTSKAWLAMLTLGGVLLAPGTANAVREYSLPSHVTIETRSFDFPNDHNRCVAWAFAEFPEIRSAKGYRLTVADTVHGTRETYSGPLFPDDHYDDYPAHYDVHPGFHWFALGGYSTGAGCAQAIAAMDGAFEIVRSSVNLDKQYEKRVRPPKHGGWKVQRCHGPGQSPVVGKPGAVLLLVKIGGVTGATISSETVPRSSLGLGSFAEGPFILETDRRSAVMVVEGGSRDFTTKESIFIGPGMKVRIEPGKRIEVLHRDPGATWDDVKRIRTAPAGRGINIGCMSARG